MFGKVEELLIFLVIILVLFGAKRLPQLARGIGESVREMRKGFAGEIDEPKKPEAHHHEVAAHHRAEAADKKSA